jgi:hypothetical protein
MWDAVVYVTVYMLLLAIHVLGHVRYTCCCWRYVPGTDARFLGCLRNETSLCLEETASILQLPLLTSKGSDRDTQVGFWVLAELALPTVSLVAGNDMVTCQHTQW